MPSSITKLSSSCVGSWCAFIPFSCVSPWQRFVWHQLCCGQESIHTERPGIRVMEESILHKIFSGLYYHTAININIIIVFGTIWTFYHVVFRFIERVFINVSNKKCRIVQRSIVCFYSNFLKSDGFLICVLNIFFECKITGFSFIILNTSGSSLLSFVSFGTC